MNTFRILDLSNRLTEKIKKFVIPRKKDKKDLLQKLEDGNDKDEIKEVEKIILDSFLDKESKFNSLHSEVFLVNNSNTNQIYEEKRSEMRKANDVTLSDVYERNLFYACEDLEEMQQISSDGFKCIETKDDEKNILGTSEMGIHLSKHADIVLNNIRKNRSKSCYVIIAKVSITKNKAKFVIPSIKNIQNDADPNYEYHISKAIPNLENDARKQFYDSLFYIYEYDELGEHMEKPRNILPYAVFHYKCQSVGLDEKQVAIKQKTIVKPRVPKQPKLKKRQTNNVPAGYISKEDQVQHNLNYLKIVNPHSLQRLESVRSHEMMNRAPYLEHRILVPNLEQMSLNKGPHLEQPDLSRAPNLDRMSLNREPHKEQTGLNRGPHLEQPKSVYDKFINDTRISSILNNPNIRNTTSVANKASATINTTQIVNRNVTSTVTNTNRQIIATDITDATKTYITIDSNDTVVANSYQVEDNQVAEDTVGYLDFDESTEDSDIEEITEYKPSLYSDDETDSEDEKDLLTLFDEWYGDLYTEESLNEKIPRWRMHYEMTGRMDIRFRAAPPPMPKCITSFVKMSDIAKTLKFSDEENTRVNLADPANRLILSYKNKNNQPLITASCLQACPTFGLKRIREPSPISLEVVKTEPVDSQVTKVQKLDDDAEARRKASMQKVKKKLEELQAKRRMKREKDEAESAAANIKQERMDLD